jgi:p-aminobenzoyl-glutamate transporter AbgT
VSPLLAGLVAALIVGIAVMPVVFGVVVGGLYGDAEAGNRLGQVAARTVAGAMGQVGLLVYLLTRAGRFLRREGLPRLAAWRQRRRSVGAAHPVEGEA